MKLAIVIVHNKTESENNEQIDILKSILTEVRLDLFELDVDGNPKPVLDELGNQITYFSHYTLNSVPFPHEVKIYQIVPFQPENISTPYKAVLPAKFNELKGHNVQYGKGDEDKKGDHPRFFNWGLKRGTDYGAEIVLHIDDLKKLKTDDIAFNLTTLIDPTDTTELIEDLGVNYSTLKLLKEVGQLKEDKSKDEALNELKEKLKEKGLKNG